MVNLQPVEKQTYRDDGALDVVSVFYTIQGEGPSAGTPAVFVRLAGCNLTCPNCDTDYTSCRELTEPITLFGRVYDASPRISPISNSARGVRGLIVITGGEPFRQDVGPFVKLLLDRGFSIQIETNGTLPPPGDLLRFAEDDLELRLSAVCSPKTPKVCDEILSLISCYKYVLSVDSVSPMDGLPLTALGCNTFPARPHAEFVGDVFVQPADEGDPGKNERNRKAAVASCLRYGYRLSLQTHKLLGLE